MGLFGSDRDALLAAQAEEIRFLRGQVEMLQKQVIVLSGDAAARAALYPAPRPTPGPPKAKDVALTPWTQSLASGGHVNLHESRRRLQSRQIPPQDEPGPIQPVPTGDAQ